MEIEEFIKKYNTEDIINAVTFMSGDNDEILRDTNIPAAEWIASNAIRCNSCDSQNDFEMKAYRQIKEIASQAYVPVIEEIFLEAINNKDAQDDKKQDIVKSMIMRIKNMSYRGDAYQFQLMEMAELLYQPFDCDFLKVYGFTFSCCEKVFIYIYLKYMGILSQIDKDEDRVKKIQMHVFRVTREELYNIFPRGEIDSLIEYLSVVPGDSIKEPVGIQDFKLLYSKPIVNYNDYIYLPLPVSTFLNFHKLFHYTFISENKFDKNIRGKYTDNRGNLIEKLAQKYLKRLFDDVYLSLMYPPETKEFEADITAQSDNITVFSEAKGKTLTLSSLHGNLESIDDDIYKAMGKAYEQAIRSIEYIENRDTFILESEKGYNEIKLKNTIWKFPVCIVADNFASIPSEIYNYVKIDAKKILPYVVNIYDFDIITRECETKEDFANYLLFRQMNIELVTAVDELDFFGYYKQNGLVKIETSADEVWATAYTEYFDQKYYAYSMKWFLDFDIR